MTLYLIQSDAPATSPAAKPVAVATGTNLKTILQVKLNASGLRRARITEWGITFDGDADGAKVSVELFAGDVKATITEHVAAGIVDLSNPDAPAATDDNPFAFGAAGDETGYDASAEGTDTTYRPLDAPLFVSPAGGIIKQLPLGQEAKFTPADYVKIRVHAAANVNCHAYMKIEV